MHAGGPPAGPSGWSRRLRPWRWSAQPGRGIRLRQAGKGMASGRVWLATWRHWLRNSWPCTGTVARHCQAAPQVCTHPQPSREHSHDTTLPADQKASTRLRRASPVPSKTMPWPGHRGQQSLWPRWQEAQPPVQQQQSDMPRRAAAWRPPARSFNTRPAFEPQCTGSALALSPPGMKSASYESMPCASTSSALGVAFIALSACSAGAGEDRHGWWRSPPADDPESPVLQ